jgi:hypothetical protein
MSRQQYISAVQREKLLASRLSAASATDEALAILNAIRQRSTPLPESPSTAQPPAKPTPGEHAILDSQGRPFRSNFTRRRPWWKF